MIDDYGERKNEALRLPLLPNGNNYEIRNLKNDQKTILAVVANKVQEWINKGSSPDFEPLRMIVTGAGGSGKSVFINTLVTMMRRMFNNNDVVKVVAPTGVAACNVGGETVHHSFKIGTHGYKRLKDNSWEKKKLLQDHKHLLALLLDERSMLCSELLGTMAQLMAESIHGGFNSHVPWGGLPIVILVGDDYQLPSIEPGATRAHTIPTKEKSKQHHLGDNLFQSFAQDVMDLGYNKRVQDDQFESRDLIDRLRIGETRDPSDITKLLALDLANIKRMYGPAEVENIKAQALYLYANNMPIAEHNLRAVCAIPTPTNPLAVIKSHGIGSSKTGLKAIAAHFDDSIPVSTVLCRFAKVAITGHNFLPTYGLHNGAVGEVEDIIFDEGDNPNNGDLPSYVVVKFPSYRGPAWDESHPKVCSFQDTKPMTSI